MDTVPSQAQRESHKAARPWGVYGVAGFLLACLIASCLSESDVPVQGWWQERGSVMPHDSFPADCTLCHEGDDWHTIRKDIEFDHEAETGYALEGAHAAALCLRCHNDRGPVQSFEARGCSGCHSDVHRGLLGQGCETCHHTDSWTARGPVADHRRTRFPLTGVHAATECWRCHPGAGVGEFSGADPECLSCHGEDLARATDPDHLGQGWANRCDRCHLPTQWDGAGFNHSTFALAGGHRIDDCADCHGLNVFEAVSNQCVDCHQQEYDDVLEPPHALHSYPTRCDYCHSIYEWEGAEVNHRALNSQCVTCHEDDYLGATDPNHAGQGHPTSCELCHTTETWLEDIFVHPWPRLGTHSFMACLDCHLTAPTITGPGSCTHCHFHEEEISADQHMMVKDYVWSNPQCIVCHPDGH